MKTLTLLLLIPTLSFAFDLKIERLDSLASLLMDNIDNDAKHCGLSAKDSKKLINVVHAKIDEESSKIKNITSLGKSCVKNCHCDLYLGILEQHLDKKRVKNSYDLITKKAKLVDAKRKIYCLENAKKQCKSELLKEIKKESENF